MAAKKKVPTPPQPSKPKSQSKSKTETSSSRKGGATMNPGKLVEEFGKKSGKTLTGAFTAGRAIANLFPSGSSKGGKLNQLDKKPPRSVPKHSFGSNTPPKNKPPMSYVPMQMQPAPKKKQDKPTPKRLPKTK